MEDKKVIMEKKETNVSNNNYNSNKAIWKSGTFIYPLPAVMVSCGTMEKSIL